MPTAEIGISYVPVLRMRHIAYAAASIIGVPMFAFRNELG